ncbi:unnamed protein product, partial [Rotaria sordida]
VKYRYAQIPLELIKLFISLCDQCASRKTFPKPVVGKPIASVGFMTRIQMDLIDMRSNEFNGFKWIFHAKDHFSKYSWLFPMASKEAINVANILRSIFYQFGPPKILQSDNGREFVPKTPFEVVFGQHSRIDDDMWKSIFNHQQQSDINKIILEEDLPDEIANIVKETDYVDFELISAQGDNDNDRLKTNEKMTNAEHQKECIDETELTVDDGSSNINVKSNDRHRRVREEAEQSYLRNAQSQLVKYKMNSAKRQRTYVIGDIVG